MDSIKFNLEKNGFYLSLHDEIEQIQRQEIVFYHL
jgi:hypothetical protein